MTTHNTSPTAKLRHGRYVNNAPGARLTTAERAWNYLTLWMGFTEAELAEGQEGNQLLRHLTQFGEQIERATKKARRKRRAAT